MESIYAFQHFDELEQRKTLIERLEQQSNAYLQMLRDEYRVTEPPEFIVWTTKKLATTAFSKVPVPAYTNATTIYIAPDIEEWIDFHLSQFDEADFTPTVATRIRSYYETMMVDDVFQILAHELTHHSDYFPDDFEDPRKNAIWFEEGMCEYLSRTFAFTPERYQENVHIESELIRVYREKLGHSSLDNFGVASYDNPSITALMLNYWRSHAAVRYLVEDKFQGAIHEVFEAYQNWHQQGRIIPLTVFFGVEEM